MFCRPCEIALSAGAGDLAETGFHGRVLRGRPDRTTRPGRLSRETGGRVMVGRAVEGRRVVGRSSSCLMGQVGASGSGEPWKAGRSSVCLMRQVARRVERSVEGRPRTAGRRAVSCDRWCVGVGWPWKAGRSSGCLMRQMGASWSGGPWKAGTSSGCLLRQAMARGASADRDGRKGCPPGQEAHPRWKVSGGVGSIAAKRGSLAVSSASESVPARRWNRWV